MAVPGCVDHGHGAPARVWLSLIGLLVSVALLGCSRGKPQEASSITEPTAGRGGSLAYAVEADPNGLDPTKNGWDPSGLLAAHAIFDPIAKFDADGQPRPYLAESWTHNDDYTEWTVKLRPGVRFHDGTPLDANAVLRFTKAIQESPITGPAAVYVSHSEKITDLEVKTVMKRPWASYPVLLTGQGGFIAAPAQLDDPEGSIHPIGTGPFKVERWELGKRLVLQRNPDYWREGLPYLDRVEFIPTGSLTDRVNGLLGGSFDVIHSSDPATNERLDELAAEGSIKVYHDPGATESNFVMFNTAVPPLDDLRVRKALAHATDRDQLLEVLGWPADLRSDGPFREGSMWFSAAAPPPYDRAAARRLVEEYEAERGPIRVRLGTTDDPVNLKLTNELARQWREAGVDVDVEAIDFKVFVIRAVAGQFEAVNFRYFGQPDPDGLWHFWTGETVRPVGQLSLNFSRLADPAITDGMRRGRESPDLETRKQAYADVLGRFAELVPYVWFARTDWVIATAPRVHEPRSRTLPDGTPAMPYVAGVHDLTETWIASRVVTGS
ncbi:MAG: ABC transporter substrate-binding protein [Acidimicrobiales bacterium]|nr:ABC transporter substrate-binding protein [Acidimicrobiales bacterium]